MQLIADTDRVIMADIRNSRSRHVGIIDDKKLEVINLEYLPHGFIYLWCILNWQYFSAM